MASRPAVPPSTITRLLSTQTATACQVLDYLREWESQGVTCALMAVQSTLVAAFAITGRWCRVAGAHELPAVSASLQARTTNNEALLW